MVGDFKSDHKNPCVFSLFCWMLGSAQDIFHPSGWMAAPESSGYLDLDFFKFGMKKLGGEKLGFLAQILSQRSVGENLAKVFCEGS